MIYKGMQQSNFEPKSGATVKTTDKRKITSVIIRKPMIIDTSVLALGKKSRIDQEEPDTGAFNAALGIRSNNSENKEAIDET